MIPWWVWKSPLVTWPHQASIWIPCLKPQLGRSRHPWPSLGRFPRGYAWVMGWPRACHYGALFRSIRTIERLKVATVLASQYDQNQFFLGPNAPRYLPKYRSRRARQRKT